MTVSDVVVIGAGHNGLVAACYLAAAGRSVTVLERDVVPGGAVSTVERFPGYRVDRGSSAHIMIRHTPIPDELDLAGHGLRYLDCDPWGWAPGAPPLIFFADVERTCASIAAACGKADADAYREFVRVWRPRSRAVIDAFCRPPTGPALARSFWGLTPRDPAGRGLDAGAALSREFLASGDALLDSWFASERLKAALAWFGAQSGPPMSEPGTAPMVGFAALLHDIPPGRAVGGSGALTDALVSHLTAHGGELRCGAAATRLVRAPRGRHPWLVRTADGVEHAATSVVAACHVLTTLDLLEAGGHDASALARWRRDVRVGGGIGMAVRLGTTALPDYGVDAAGLGLPAAGVHSALGLLVTDRAQLRLAHGQAAAGLVPDEPAVIAMSYSAIDPSLAPPGRHQVSLWAQWHPYRPRAGAPFWADAADAVVAQVERHAPGFTSTIEHRHVQDPAALEAELGLVGGNIMHVEMSLDQMLLFRPAPDLATGRVPGAPGLLLAGASTHPGGGVTGASGRRIARLLGA